MRWGRYYPPRYARDPVIDVAILTGLVLLGQKVNIKPEYVADVARMYMGKEPLTLGPKDFGVCVG